MIRNIRKAALIWRFWSFSDVTELVTMLAWFVANTYWTWQDKLAGYRLMNQKEWTRENEMGFGQIVPLVLLMLPLMVFMETYHGESTVKIYYWIEADVDRKHGRAGRREQRFATERMSTCCC